MSTTHPTAQEQIAPEVPLILRWCAPDQPLPVREVRATSNAGRVVGREAPPYWNSGEPGQPFDFCAAVRRLCEDLVRRTSALAHIDTRRLLFCVTQARSGRRRGLQARVTPLRFAEGKLLRLRRGVVYQVQRYFVNGREMLYLVTFCLPRFLDQSYEEKFITLFHELYHIGPHFDGDLRRGGRGRLHLHGKREYDARMADLAREYLASRPDSSLFNFLRLDFAQLLHRHGSVLGVTVPRPKIVPIAVRDPRPGAL